MLKPASVIRRTSSSVIAACSPLFRALRQLGDPAALGGLEAHRLVDDPALQDARRAAARHDEFIGPRYPGRYLGTKPADGRDEKHGRFLVLRSTGEEHTRGPGADHALHQHGHRRIDLREPRRPPVEDRPGGEPALYNPLPGLRHLRLRAH